MPESPGRLSLSAGDLRVEARSLPLGIDARTPRLSWKLRSDARSVEQAAYRIQVADAEAGWAGTPSGTAGGWSLPIGGCAVRRPAPAFRRAIFLAGARLEYDRRRLGMERGRLVGDGVAGGGRLDGTLRSARPMRCAAGTVWRVHIASTHPTPRLIRERCSGGGHSN